MRKNILFISLFMLVTEAFSQDTSERVKNLLQRVYNKVQKQNAIKISFSYTLENAEENIHQETSGLVYIEGDKYRLEYLGITKIFDGKKIYTIVPDNEEVTIETKGEEENKNITPLKMLTFYREGYTYKWDILQTIPRRKIQYVKLNPIKTDSEMKYILVGIDNKTYELYTVIQVGKNNIKTTISVDKYEVKDAFFKNPFSFDKNYYKDRLNYYIQEI